MKVTNPCEGSGLKTTNPITGEYFKTSVCTHCKDVRGVTWDYKINRFKFGNHHWIIYSSVKRKDTDARN